MVDVLLITHEHGDHYDLGEVKRVQEQHPEVLIITNTSVAGMLEEEGIVADVLEGGQKKSVKGVTIEAIGKDHAIIHDDIPCISNVGYMIGEDFFYPGDSFTLPERAVKVLALPISAPWMAVKEAIDYAREVSPEHAIAVHDAVLSDAGRAVHHRVISGQAPDGMELHELDLGKEYSF